MFSGKEEDLVGDQSKEAEDKFQTRQQHSFQFSFSNENSQLQLLIYQKQLTSQELGNLLKIEIRDSQVSSEKRSCL